MLLRDIVRGDDPQIAGIAETLLIARADILVLQGVDYDLQSTALNALADLLESKGLQYPYRFALRPNTGMQTGLDMDGNGTLGEARDAQGYGEFSGQGGMALLSRWPIDLHQVQDFSALLWQDFPDALLPANPDGTPFPSVEVLSIQRLSTTGHWVIPIDPPDAERIWVAAFHATPPVFDGPEDRNGKRNHDEAAFWSRYLDGVFGPPPRARFVIAGDANADPTKGDSLKSAIKSLITDPRLQDPLSGSPTVMWPAPGPGALRVDYLLPTIDLRVLGKGRVDAGDASRHDLIWLDLE